MCKLLTARYVQAGTITARPIRLSSEMSPYASAAMTIAEGEIPDRAIYSAERPIGMPSAENTMNSYNSARVHFPRNASDASPSL